MAGAPLYFLPNYSLTCGRIHFRVKLLTVSVVHNNHGLVLEPVLWTHSTVSPWSSGPSPGLVCISRDRLPSLGTRVTVHTALVFLCAVLYLSSSSTASNLSVSSLRIPRDLPVSFSLPSCLWGVSVPSSKSWKILKYHGIYSKWLDLLALTWIMLQTLAITEVRRM